MSQHKKIFPIVFKTNVIDPDSHVRKDVINWMQNFSERVDFFERATVRKIINFQLLHSGIRKLLETATYDFDWSIDDSQSNYVSARMEI